MSNLIVLSVFMVILSWDMLCASAAKDNQELTPEEDKYLPRKKVIKYKGKFYYARITNKPLEKQKAIGLPNCIYSSEAGKYVSCRWIKLIGMFHFSKPIKNLRMKAYWKVITAHILMGIYFVILIAGRLIVGSFDFVEETYFKYYPLFMYAYIGFYEIGAVCYGKIEKCR